MNLLRGLCGINKEAIKELLKQSVSDCRYVHAQNVAQTAKELARQFNVDTEKAWIAGLLHDCARGFDDEPDNFLLMAKEAGITPTQNQLTNPSLFLHAQLSAYIAEHDYEIEDIEILNAISRHQAGNYKMTKLDKIIYVSDLIEPSRKGMEYYHELSKSDLDETFFQLYSNSIMNVVKNGWSFFDNVSDIYNAHVRKRNGKRSATRMIILDLDNTLLTSDKCVTSDTAKALNECKRRGMYIGYITARSPRKTGQFLKDLPCDCIAYYNGATVYVGDSIISSNLIPYQQGIQIIDALTKKYPTIKVGVYMEPYSYFENEIRNINTGETRACSVYDLPCHDIQRIRVIFNGNDNLCFNELMTENTIYYVSTDETAIIINKNATKEQALITLSNYLNISVDNVIVFGDDINDIGMLKTAGTGVAMGNAVAAVKKNADYITQTNDNEGISLWLKENLLV